MEKIKKFVQFIGKNIYKLNDGKLITKLKRILMPHLVVEKLFNIIKKYIKNEKKEIYNLFYFYWLKFKIFYKYN